MVRERNTVNTNIFPKYKQNNFLFLYLDVRLHAYVHNIILIIYLGTCHIQSKIIMTTEQTFTPTKFF